MCPHFRCSRDPAQYWPQGSFGGPTRPWPCRDSVSGTASSRCGEGEQRELHMLRRPQLRTVTMRRRLFPALLCLTVSFPAVARSDDLAISLSRDVAAGRPVLAMTVVNRSERTICLRAELLGNPGTGEIAPIRLRDARGRPIRASRDPEGYIPRPIPGVVRLDPGDVTRAHYYIDWRFDWPGGMGRPLPPAMSAQVTFRYGYCEDTRALRATSTWQPI